MDTTLGEKIKSLRNKLGWSLDQLAQKSNVSKAYLSQLENGDSEHPSAEILYNIATALGTSIADLLGKRIETNEERVQDLVPANLNKAAVQYNIPADYVKRMAAVSRRTHEKKAEILILLMTGSSSIKLFSGSTNQSDQISEEYIAEECQKLIEEAGISSAPLDLRFLASLRDVVSIEEDDMKEAGILLPLKSGGLKILLRQSDSMKRKKFSLGHEITHTFFPDFKLKPQKRVDSVMGEYNRKNRVECLCDYGASQLIMPTVIFRPEFNKLGFSLNTLHALSAMFQASLEATGIRMVSENPENHAFIVWEEKFKPTEQILTKIPMLFEQYRPKEKLRIKFGFGMQSLGHIPNDKSLSESENVIQSALDTNSLRRGVEKVDFGTFSVECKIEALPVGFMGKRRVLALLELK